MNDRLTPERLAEITALIENPWGDCHGKLVNACEDLLDEVERLTAERDDAYEKAVKVCEERQFWGDRDRLFDETIQGCIDAIRALKVGR